MKIEMSDILKDPNVLYTNGTITFFSTAKGIGSDIVGRKDIDEKVNLFFSEEKGFSQKLRDNVAKGLVKYNIKGTLIDGKSFLAGIKEGKYYNNLGKINKIIVSGYVSNLGIYYKNDGKYCSSDGFAVNLDVFEKLCNKYPVRVDWSEHNDNPIVME